MHTVINLNTQNEEVWDIIEWDSKKNNIQEGR